MCRFTRGPARSARGTAAGTDDDAAPRPRQGLALGNGQSPHAHIAWPQTSVVVVAVEANRRPQVGMPRPGRRGACREQTGPG